jgi:hypothetical protein
MVGSQNQQVRGFMTCIVLTPEIEDVHSTPAISAPAKERFRMQTQRYQRGSLSVMKRKSLPDAWFFRYYTAENGQRVYKRKFVGTVIDLPKRKDAEKAVTQLRVDVNEGAAFAPLNFEQLVAHFKANEMPNKAYSTREAYKNLLDVRVSPKWGKYTLSAIKSVEVEGWLGDLKKIKGEPVSPATKAKIRNLMSALFAHAIRHEWQQGIPSVQCAPQLNGFARRTFLLLASSRHFCLSCRSVSGSWCCWPGALAFGAGS